MNGKLAYIDEFASFSLLMRIDVEIVAHALINRLIQAFLHLLLQ